MGTTAYSSSSRATEQGLPTVYNRAPAALPPTDNQGAPATFRPPPASLYSSLQGGGNRVETGTFPPGEISV